MALLVRVLIQGSQLDCLSPTAVQDPTVPLPHATFVFPPLLLPGALCGRNGGPRGIDCQRETFTNGQDCVVLVLGDGIYIDQITEELRGQDNKTTRGHSEGTDTSTSGATTKSIITKSGSNSALEAF